MQDETIQARRRIARVVAAVVVLGIVVLVLVWAIFFRSDDAAAPRKDPADSAQTAADPDVTSPSSNSTEQNQGSRPGAAPGSGSPRTETLVTVGPGNTLTLFLGATVVGGLGHAAYRRLTSGRRPARA